MGPSILGTNEEKKLNVLEITYIKIWLLDLMGDSFKVTSTWTIMPFKPLGIYRLVTDHDMKEIILAPHAMLFFLCFECGT